LVKDPCNSQSSNWSLDGAAGATYLLTLFIYSRLIGISGLGSAVGTATGYRQDGPGIESQHGHG